MMIRHLTTALAVLVVGLLATNADAFGRRSGSCGTHGRRHHCHSHCGGCSTVTHCQTCSTGFSSCDSGACPVSYNNGIPPQASPAGTTTSFGTSGIPQGAISGTDQQGRQVWFVPNGQGGQYTMSYGNPQQGITQQGQQGLSGQSIQPAPPPQQIQQQPQGPSSSQDRPRLPSPQP